MRNPAVFVVFALLTGCHSNSDAGHAALGLGGEGGMLLPALMLRLPSMQ